MYIQYKTDIWIVIVLVNGCYKYIWFSFVVNALWKYFLIFCTFTHVKVWTEVALHSTALSRTFRKLMHEETAPEFCLCFLGGKLENHFLPKEPFRVSPWQTTSLYLPAAGPPAMPRDGRFRDPLLRRRRFHCAKIGLWFCGLSEDGLRWSPSSL